MSFEDLESPLTRTPAFRRGQRVKYVPNHTSFGAFLRSAQMRDVTAEVAADIATSAAGKVGPGGGEQSRGLHDRVRKGFRVVKGRGLMEVGGNLRVRVDVVNDVPGSALIEFGARGIARDRMLGRAGAEHGDFKPEDGPK